MTFSPVLPLGGVGGWALLQRVEDTQRAAFESRVDVAREAARFRERIGGVATAEALVSDRRLLEVALTAFGLESEIDKRALVRRALESDPSDPQSFANRLVDRRYRDLASAFGFGSILGPRTLDVGFAEEISARYLDRRFEIAVGDGDPSLRLALNARREMARIASEPNADEAGWLAVLGDRPLRAVVEGAFGLPAAFSQVDVDRQVETLEQRSRSAFGEASPAVFADPEALDTLIRRFLIRDGASAGPSSTTPGFAALSILGGALGPGASQGLLLSIASR